MRFLIALFRTADLLRAGWPSRVFFIVNEAGDASTDPEHGFVFERPSIRTQEQADAFAQSFDGPGIARLYAVETERAPSTPFIAPGPLLSPYRAAVSVPPHSPPCFEGTGCERCYPPDPNRD